MERSGLRFETFAHKRCKIAAQKKVVFLANFVLLAGFLAAQSSSRSLVVCWSVGLLVGLSDTLVQIWPLEYQMRVSD